jgi:hypothetical protein
MPYAPTSPAVLACLDRGEAIFLGNRYEKPRSLWLVTLAVTVRRRSPAMVVIDTGPRKKGEQPMRKKLLLLAAILTTTLISAGTSVAQEGGESPSATASPSATVSPSASPTATAPAEESAPPAESPPPVGPPNGGEVIVDKEAGPAPTANGGEVSVGDVNAGGNGGNAIEVGDVNAGVPDGGGEGNAGQDQYEKNDDGSVAKPDSGDAAKSDGLVSRLLNWIFGTF